METVLLIIYAAASYWATNKVLYEGKVVYYSSAYVHYMKKFLIGMMFGWILIPIAILKCIFSNRFGIGNKSNRKITEKKE